MQATARTPSRWWYVIGAAVIVLGFAGLAVYVATQAGDIVPDTRFVVPGVHEVQLDSVGKYTVFYEYRSVIDGEVYSTPELTPRMSAGLTSKEGSHPIEVSRPNVGNSYATNNYEGRSVLEFQIDEPGTYIFAAQYDAGETGPDVVFAVGKSHVMRFVLVGFGIGFGSIVVGLLVIVIALIRRHTAAKRMRTISTSDMGTVSSA